MVFNQQTLPYSLVVNYEYSLTLPLYCPCLCCLSFLWWYGLFLVEANLCRFFIVCLYMYYRWRSNYKDGRVRIPLTGLTPPYICDEDMDWETSCAVDFFVFSEFSWDEWWLFVLLILVMTITVYTFLRNWSFILRLHAIRVDQ